MVSINHLADVVMEIAGKRLKKRYVEGPTGVRGRTSDNRLISARLGWRPSQPLKEGLEKTYNWIEKQL
jgi:nucleoside-diphosphate-sugar epimerase